MKNIVIVSKVVIGSRPIAVGPDKGLNIFKKSISTNLKNTLNEIFKAKNMNCIASVDHTYDTLDKLINDGADLLVLSPYIKTHIDTSNLSKDDYYMLSEEDFNNANVEKIIDYLEKLDK